MSCPACERPYAPAGDSCGAVAYFHAHRYGHEPHWAAQDDLEPQPHCHDCGTPVGGHHHANCLQAYCSVCGDQAACCPHNIGEI